VIVRSAVIASEAKQSTGAAAEQVWIASSASPPRNDGKSVVPRRAVRG